MQSGLVRCPVDGVRQTFVSLISSAIHSVCQNFQGTSTTTAHIIGDFVESLNSLVPFALQNGMCLSQFGEVYEAIARNGDSYVNLLRDKDTLAFLLHLYLGPKSPGHDLAKLGTIGTSANRTSSSRLEPNFDAILRTCSMLLCGAPHSHFPKLSGNLLGMSYAPTAAKLCDSDPMGGYAALKSHTVEPLLLEICMKADARLVLEVGQSLVSQLHKVCQDQLSRMHQLRCVHFLFRLLERASDTSPSSFLWAARDGEISEVCDHMLQNIIQQMRRCSTEEGYGRKQGVGGLTARRRLAQLIALLGKSPNMRSMMQTHGEALALSALQMHELSCGREQGILHATRCETVEECLTMIENCISAAIPDEIYISGGTGGLSMVNGWYTLEIASQHAPKNSEWSNSPVYVKKDISVVKRSLEVQGKATEQWIISQKPSRALDVKVLLSAASLASPGRALPIWSEWVIEISGNGNVAALQILGQV